MMDHMTEVSGLSWPRRILNTLQNDDRLLAGGAAFLGGLMTAMGRITGEVAPFGVAYAAAAPRRMTVPALLGAALGYLLMTDPPAAWQYPLAALLAVGLVHTGAAYCLYFSALKELPGQTAALLS